MGLEYLRVLAWPLVVVFLLWRFKAQTGRLLDRLVSLKTPAGTAEFDRQAREVSIEAQGAELEEGQPDQRTGDGADAAAGSKPPETSGGSPDRDQQESASPKQ